MWRRLVLGGLVGVLVACGGTVLGCADDDDAGAMPDPGNNSATNNGTSGTSGGTGGTVNNTPQEGTFPETCNAQGLCWPEHTCTRQERILCSPGDPDGVCPAGTRCLQGLGVCLSVCSSNEDCPTGYCSTAEFCWEPQVWVDPVCPLEWLNSGQPSGTNVDEECPSATLPTDDTYEPCLAWE